MREIKFRGWEPELKKYYFFDLYTLYCISPLRMQTPKPNESRAMILFNINHRPFEQFTGLRDKNGKEIYEGDRCNILLSSGEYTTAIVTIIDGCFELEFGYPVVINGRRNTRDYLKCHTVNHAVEVIGNIHENLELLETK